MSCWSPRQDQTETQHREVSGACLGVVLSVYSLQSCIQTQSKELNICDVFDWSHEFSRSQDMFSEAV